jgi:hypothetical protein
MALAGNDPERAKVIWIKVRLAEAFPVSYKEMNPADPNTIVNTFIVSPAKPKPHLAKYRAMIPGYPPLPGLGESSACLLMALNTLGTDGGVAVQDQLGYAITDTDGDGVKELIDGWGKPLAFFRFPWNNGALQNANPAAGGSSRNAKFADPADTGGTLMNNNWYSSGFRNTFEGYFHPVRNASGNANFVIPVIVSAGPDGKFGLTFADPTLGLNSLDVGTLLPEMSIGPAAVPPPTGSPPWPYDPDNIYSFNLKLD